MISFCFFFSSFLNDMIQYIQVSIKMWKYKHEPHMMLQWVCWLTPPPISLQIFSHRETRSCCLISLGLVLQRWFSSQISQPRAKNWQVDSFCFLLYYKSNSGTSCAVVLFLCVCIRLHLIRPFAVPNSVQKKMKQNHQAADTQGVIQDRRLSKNGAIWTRGHFGTQNQVLKIFEILFIY